MINAPVHDWYGWVDEHGVREVERLQEGNTLHIPQTKTKDSLKLSRVQVVIVEESCG